MIERAVHRRALAGLLRRHRVVSVLGPRQVGKTTLVRQVLKQLPARASVFDLEDPADVALLAEPMLALRPLKGLVVIDEVQRLPELFPILRVLADRSPAPARFLLLGSASPDLLQRTAESLAGRVAFYELPGLSLEEVGTPRLNRLWVRGGFPRSYLASSDAASLEWRREFIRTFLERDLPQLGVAIPAATLRRFWTMLAHFHGQIWNASPFASSFGVADTTVRRHLDLLTGSFVVRQLQPWHENLKKRQVKAPKVYIADSGVLHALLGVATIRDLLAHPKLGASWEGLGLEAVALQLRARSDECYFWATHAGAELDLLVIRGRQRLGFEFKRTEQPEITRSMRIAMQDLSLTSLTVVHAGPRAFDLGPGVRAVPMTDVGQLEPLR